MRFLWGLNEILYVKCLEQRLIGSKCYESACRYYYYKTYCHVNVSIILLLSPLSSFLLPHFSSLGFWYNILLTVLDCILTKLVRSQRIRNCPFGTLDKHIMFYISNYFRLFQIAPHITVETHSRTQKVDGCSETGEFLQTTVVEPGLSASPWDSLCSAFPTAPR